MKAGVQKGGWAKNASPGPQSPAPAAGARGVTYPGKQWDPEAREILPTTFKQYFNPTYQPAHLEGVCSLPPNMVIIAHALPLPPPRSSVTPPPPPPSPVVPPRPAAQPVVAPVAA